MRRMTRRSFIKAGVAVAAGAGGFYWLKSLPQVQDLAWPFRTALETNERLANALFDPQKTAVTHQRDLAETPRINGEVGVGADFDPAQWQLHVTGLATAKALSLTDIQALPRHEMVTELMCIEGWSTVVQWAGVRFADFVARFASGIRTRYVHLTTPDDAYYVGLDMASAMHPQTLLAFEMNGAPLSLDHGAPLRLVIPVKYGVKNIKRIGTIRFTDERPADYWAEKGYDWYAGL
ncbi:MAG: molybdopterin-dependent oxidoreductase [Candidatus Sericytochromatia bacterium]|nr:molybdopterin-dependent oxidoreductase [Candidatus Sericytochromatia bacterium]